MLYNTDDENVRQVWKNILEKLREQVDADLVAACFQTLTPRYVTKNKLCLITGDKFHREWVLEDELITPLKEAVKKVLGDEVSVSIALTGQLTLPTIMPRQAIMPNSLARSALFGVQSKGRPVKYLEQVELRSWAGIALKYTGAQLDQLDLDILLQCLRMVKNNGLGKPIKFTAHEFLKAMGKSIGSAQYKMLERRFTRLVATAIDIKVGHISYVGGLLDRYTRNEETKVYSIIIDPLISTLFEDNQYSRIDWEQRMKLRGQLSKFLHAYLATHSTKKGPHFINVQKLRELSRSSAKHRWKFREQLRNATDELGSVGALSDSWIDENDTVYFIRNTNVIDR